jgi:chemotaxis protein methyltransferase CheR
VAQADYIGGLDSQRHRTDAAVDALPQAEDRLAALLERGLGLAPTPQMLEGFVKQSKLRAHSLGIEESSYVRLLELGGPAARSEWMAVAPALVVGETFLFRDAQLWKLIENTLLPDLAKVSRPLWMWSAGCSTGEEAYTLAIVARRVLGDGGARILATDVNPKAVAAARVGVYGQWSLRGVDSMQRDGLTINGTQTVRVHDDVKSIVRFETHNLNDESAYPPAGMNTFEMILCRNVLIYMSHAARTRIIGHLAQAIAPGGVLILGHGEAAGIDILDLTVERHEAGVVYRRPLQPAPQPRRDEAPAAPRTAPRKHVASKPRGTADKRTSPARERKPATPAAAGNGAASHAAARAASSNLRCRELLAVAMGFARSGNLAAAERDVAAAIVADTLDPEPHVLLAALMMARGALREAETEVRRALFLDPVFVPALWQAGNLYGMTDRKRQAAFAFARALTQLDGLPPESEALPFDNLTVGELSTLLRAELGERVEA